MRKFYKSTIGIAAAALLVGSLAACSTPTESEPTEPAESSSEEAPAADPEPLASIPDLSGGIDTQVALAPTFLEAITGLGLTPGVTGTATLDAATGTLAFPITGGNVDYYDPAEDYRPYVQGEILHDGSGITLTAGDIVVGLSDFRIDPGSDSTLFGTVTVGETVLEDVNIFRLDGTTLNPLDTDSTPGAAVLEGTTVYVSEDAAALLNETFGTTAVTGDLEVGIAKITAALPA